MTDAVFKASGAVKISNRLKTCPTKLRLRGVITGTCILGETQDLGSRNMCGITVEILSVYSELDHICSVPRVLC